MKVLVACEFSATVRDEFRALGHDAWSCDLDLCLKDPAWHIQADVRSVLSDGWDLMIGHPPCTYLTIAANKWHKLDPTREQKRIDAVSFFVELMNAPISRIALENPKGVLKKLYRAADQYVHPYFFGDPYSKMTGLWLKNLPKLVSTNLVEPMSIVWKGKKYNPIHSNYSKKTRSKLRSITYIGLAKAMALQWGSLNA